MLMRSPFKQYFLVCVFWAMLIAGVTALAVSTGYAAVLVVTNTNNDGAGSLRAAITAASPGDTITFDPGLSGGIIELHSELAITKNIIIDGTGLGVPINISGVDQVRVFFIDTNCSVTLVGLRIVNGYAVSGGGIYNLGSLMVKNSIFSNNNAQSGGGISNFGELILEKCWIEGNSAINHGGGIFNGGNLVITNSTISGNQASTDYGGGIHNYFGDLSITGSTLFDNHAGYGGGGIYQYQGALKSDNCTFSSNQSAYGGGIYNDGGGILRIVHGTFSNNQASFGGSGIFNYDGTLNYANTILANQGSDCFNNDTIGTNVHNLVYDGSCDDGTTTNLDGDPMLASLANNGGPTLTHALLPASPAIDAAHPDYCTNTDQRGVSRPRGAACDIGAFEYDIVSFYLPLILK